MARSFTTTSDKISVADNAALDITGAVSLYCWVKTAAGGPHALISKAEGNAETPNLNPYDLSIVAAGGSAPTLQGQGATQAGTTGNLTPVIPSHQANDILIVSAAINSPNAVAPPIGEIPTPSGWTLAVAQVGYDPLLGGDYVAYHALFWKRAASGAEGDPTITRGAGWDTGTDTCFGARVYVVRGCVTTGDPWDAISSAGPYILANQNFPAVTVSGSARTVIIFGGGLDDTAFSMASSGWTTGTEDNDATGTGCVFQTARKENVSSSTSADTATVSLPVEGPYVFFGVSFKPVPGADTLKFKRANASVTNSATSAFTITAGDWTFLAATDKNDNSANGMKLYKNNDAPENFTATSLTVSGNAKPVLIGERDTALGGNVTIAWAGLHNVELTAEEVREAKERGFTPRGLVGAWPLFGDATEPDLSGNSFNGTVTDTTVVAGPPVLPPWYRPVQEDIAAIKNEEPGYPTSRYFFGTKLYHQFTKTARFTGTTDVSGESDYLQQGFDLNNLTD